MCQASWHNSVMTKVAIIGAGQQGGSIARALARAEGGYSLAVYDASPEARAQFAGIVGGDPSITIYETAQDAVHDADIIVLATPISEFRSVLTTIANHTKTGTVITDIGSGKVEAITQIRAALPARALFVPAHPIAGRAQSGPAASDPDLYKDQTVVVIPSGEQAAGQAQVTVERMWTDMGANIAHMSALTHDRLYGTISHFQHVVALALTSMGAAQPEDHKKSGNSMLDTTRIAGGISPDMWAPIFRDNKAAIMMAVQGFEAQLDKVEAALRGGETGALESLLRPAHQFRARIAEDRPRERLAGEVYDIAREQGIDDVDSFDAASIQSRFNAAANTKMVRRTLLPTALAVALTLNARQTDAEMHDVEMTEVANPSFKDGSAPMLNHPDYVAALLGANRDQVLEQLHAFRKEFESLCVAIRDDDEPAMRAYMECASRIRKDHMPPHRAPDKMRNQFVFSEGAAQADAS
jgi:prephenate dehydrogenase